MTYKTKRIYKTFSDLRKEEARSLLPIEEFMQAWKGCGVDVKFSFDSDDGVFIPKRINSGGEPQQLLMEVAGRRKWKPGKHIPLFQARKPNYALFKRNIFGADIENDPTTGRFSCGAVYQHGNSKFFTSSKEMVRFMLDQAVKWQTVFFLFHNLDYDLGILDRRQLFRRLPSNEKPICATFGEAREGKVVLLDTAKYFPATKLKKLADMIGMEKGGDDGALLKKVGSRIYTELPPDLQAEMRKYNMLDAEITFKAFEFLRKFMLEKRSVDILGKKKAYTLASIATADIQTNALGNLVIPGRPQFIQDWEREAAHGGRTELFDLNPHPKAVHLDVVSEYPNKMLCDMPDPRSYKPIGETDILDVIKNAPYFIVDIDVHIPYSYVGIVPIRVVNETSTSFSSRYAKDATIDRKIYPTGDLRLITTSDMVQEMMMNGCTIKKCYGGVIYTKMMRSPFIKYVDFWYGVKSKAKAGSAEYTLGKLMMNAFTGKMNERRFTTFVSDEFTEQSWNIIIKLATDRGYEYELKPDEKNHTERLEIRTADPPHSIPLWYGRITTLGQIQLYNALKSVKPTYCDTDSVIGDYMPDVKIGKELGDFSRENTVSFKGIAPKVYVKTFIKDGKLKRDMKTKGYARPDPESEEFSQLFSLCENAKRGDIIPLVGKRPMSERMSVRRGIPSGLWDDWHGQITVGTPSRKALPDGESEPYTDEEIDFEKIDARGFYAWKKKYFAEEAKSGAIETTQADSAHGDVVEWNNPEKKCEGPEEIAIQGSSKKKPAP